MTRSDLNVERVRHPLKMRLLTVTRVERIAGLLARITFTGEDLQDFVSASFDDHVKVFFPADPALAPVLPTAGPDGIKFPEDVPRPAARDYTPRRFDTARQELEIEFVLHGDGPASTWAEQARPGQQLGIGESRFHALRNEWLQGSLELLEPRRMGRPPQASAPAEFCRRLEAVEAENRELAEQLAVADVRRELAEALPDLGRTARRPPKKSTPARAVRKRKRRR